MRYALKLFESAISDVDEIFEWYEGIDVNLSMQFEFYLIEAYELIVQNPNLFQFRYENIRVRFVDKFPYGIHYRVVETEIQILSVFHTSRSPQNWLTRIKKKQ